MSSGQHVEVLVVGAGIAGISTAWALCDRYRKSSVLLLDSRPPMSFTSAQSGDNYRNWWPHPTMTAFTNDSIDLMETIARRTANAINMTRRGYLLATREPVGKLVDALYPGYALSAADDIRPHESASSSSYLAPDNGDWRAAPRGVDILSGGSLIRRYFPSLDPRVAHAIHIRRAGDFSSQQLAQYMLGVFSAQGGRRHTGQVRALAHGSCYSAEIESSAGIETVTADVVVNAAGPFAAELARMLGVDLPIRNLFQQKLAFEDSRGAIPRRLPFAIDLDDISLGWDAGDAALLAADPTTAWLTERLPGGVHCRPEGGDHGRWVKLGWAFNREASAPLQDPANEPRKIEQFPEIVMRAAAQLQPALAAYVDDMPVRRSHYGGYYTMTQENWPLIGPMNDDGAFIVGALSGFGSMAACAAGVLCATWICDGKLPEYARQLSPARYEDKALLQALNEAASKGVL